MPPQCVQTQHCGRAAQTGLDHRDIVMHLQRRQAKGIGRLAKSHNRRPFGQGGLYKDVNCRHISRQNSRASGHQPSHDIRLLAGNTLQAFKGFHMRRGHGCDHCHMRLHHFAQRRNFSRMIHANFENGKLGVRRHARQRQRHPPMVVVTGHRGMCPPLKLKHRAQHLLGRGLAHRSGHCQNFRRATCPCRPAQVNQRLQDIRHNQQRCSLRHPIRAPLHQSGSRAFLEGLRHKIMTITGRSQSNKKIPRLQCACVNRHAMSLPGRRTIAACRSLSLESRP